MQLLVPSFKEREKNCFLDLEPHFKEIWIDIFPEKELGGLSPNFPIHVYSHVRSIYFPAAEQADLTEEYINLSQKHECRN
jgi:hypothetical protein